MSEHLRREGAPLSTNPNHCLTCDGRGWYWDTRRQRGWGVLHNERVRNYSGGPRPNMRTDYNESFRQRCDCPAGERWNEWEHDD
jgi:hypothetical protein